MAVFINDFCFAVCQSKAIHPVTAVYSHGSHPHSKLNLGNHSNGAIIRMGEFVFKIIHQTTFPVGLKAVDTIGNIVKD